MPVVRVVALKVERAADIHGQDFVIGKVRRVPTQLIEVLTGNLRLDLIPPFWSIAQLVWLLADDLDYMLPRGRARGVPDRRGQHQQGRLVIIQPTLAETLFG